MEREKMFEEFTEESAREEICKHFKNFLDTDGRLPEGFSDKYNWHLSCESDFICHGTPFREYLKKISYGLDELWDDSGISDWLYWDGSTEISSAVEEILQWVKSHREENRILYEIRQRIIGRKSITMPVRLYCEEKVMVVMEDGSAFRNVPEETIQRCKSENVSFCVILSENELFDLIQQNVKEIVYDEYPNCHDEIHGEWRFE